MLHNRVDCPAQLDHNMTGNSDKKYCGVNSNPSCVFLSACRPHTHTVSSEISNASNSEGLELQLELFFGYGAAGMFVRGTQGVGIKACSIT